MAGHDMSDEDPNADPPAEHPLTFPPPPPAHPRQPASPPHAAGPPESGWGPVTPPSALPPWAEAQDDHATAVDPGGADPWRIPPQPRWDPAHEPPPPPDDQHTATDGPPPGWGPAYQQPIPTQPVPQHPNPPFDPSATAYDLPPSATSPRSTPRPPVTRLPGGGHETGPRPVATPPAVYNEPWRRETAQRSRRRRGGLRLRPILLGFAGLVVLALIAGGVVVLVSGRGPLHHDRTVAGPVARLAGGVFAPDPSVKTDGRDQELTGVASAGSIVVAVGGETDTADYRAEFLVSSDGGRSFRLADVRTPDGAEPGYGDTPRVVAGAEGAWVALGGSRAGTAVWTSRDGRTWTRQPDATGSVFGHDKITRVTRTSSGFVAVGDTSQKGDYSDAVPVVWLSPDGRQWERLGNDQLKMSLSGGPLSLIDVAAHGNAVLAYGWTTNGKGQVVKDGVWRSADGGRTWTTADVPHPKGTAGPGIAISATPTGFVAGRNANGKSEHYGVVLTSADGQSWQPAGEIHLPGYGGLQRIAGSDRGLVAVIGADKKVLLARSDDGRTWQNGGEVATSPGRTVDGVAVTAGATVVAGHDNDGQDADALLAVRDSLGQEIPVDLTAVTGAVRPDQTVTSVASAANLRVAVGGTNGDGAVWTSPDGTRWTRAGDPGQALTRPGAQRLVNVANGGAGWLAVGYDAAKPLVVTSPDGATWHAASDFDPGSGGHVATYAAAAGPSGYVIAGESGSSAGVWFSADLKSWQTADGGDLGGTSSAARWMRGVVAGPSGYVAVGGLTDPDVKDAPQGRPAVWTSADGKKWTLKELSAPSGALEGWFDKVAVHGGALVATGTATTSSGRIAFAFVSLDGGASWQEVRLPVAGPGGADSSDRNSAITAVTATPRGFVLAGAAGRPGRADVVLWTSADGRTWAAQAPQGTGLSGRGDQWLTGMTAAGPDLLAVGITADHLGEQPTLWRRPLP